MFVEKGVDEGMDGWVCGLSKWYLTPSISVQCPFQEDCKCMQMQLDKAQIPVVPVWWTRATSITIVLSSTTPILSQTFHTTPFGKPLSHHSLLPYLRVIICFRICSKNKVP